MYMSPIQTCEGTLQHVMWGAPCSCSTSLMQCRSTNIRVECEFTLLDALYLRPFAPSADSHKNISCMTSGWWDWLLHLVLMGARSLFSVVPVYLEIWILLLEQKRHVVNE